MATRAILFIGCWAVSETPAVWVWKRIQVRAFFAPKRSVIVRYQMLARCTILRDLFEEVVMRVEEEAQARGEVVDVESAAQRPSTYSTPS